jgi:DNA-binding CsgD family transcriptional regulator
VESSDSSLQIVDRLYSVVTAPQEWRDALAAIVEYVGGDHGIMFSGGGVDAQALGAGIDDSSARLLLSPDLSRISEPLFRRLPTGVATPLEAVMSRRDFERSALYNEAVRSWGGYDSVTLHGLSPGAGFAVNVCRRRRQGAFAARQIARLQGLSPHLSNALTLRGRLRTAESHGGSLTRLLDRLATGVILADATARPLFLNAAAQAVVAEAGLNIQGARIASATPQSTRQLREAIAAVASGEIGTRRLCLPDAEGRPLLLSLSPVQGGAAGMLGPASPNVAIFVERPDAPGPLDRDAIVEVLGLTPRETEIAVLLAGGLNPKQIADGLSLKESTVRSHINRALAKAGVHSQSGLVARIRGFVDPLRRIGNLADG